MSERSTSAGTGRRNHTSPAFHGRRVQRLQRQLMQFGFRAIGTAAPRLAGRCAYRLWFKTYRYQEPERERRLLAQAERLTLNSTSGPVAAYRWGTTAPSVLLVHGWNGRGAQMGAFVEPLQALGYSVIAFDAPGHGRSTGSRTDVFEVGATIRALADRYGPLHALVAHSFGAMCSAVALNTGLPCERVVCISPPASADWLLEKFGELLTLPPRVQTRLRHLFARDYGDDVWERASPRALVQTLSTPALVIHDENDTDVPWQQGEAVAAAWQGARFLRTRGLGHRRILRDRKVIDAAIDFIRVDGGGS